MRIVRLPEQQIGEASDRPFLVVFDQVDDMEVTELQEKTVADQIGARAMFAFRTKVDIE